ncbi:MAG: mannose-1-phosphate guanylyltransferase/mannose-6-phosphate isomerase [Halothiobacillaceae bacterium]|nr:mannose-1-phosphate guanylyltransferase/mannose-6-phosphate isomerase [Halothiobacillaceae bacterium]
MNSKLIPVILCGGAGARLWPLSRELHPKPFIRMADGQSLLQKVFLRAGALADVHQIVVATNRELGFKTEDEFAEINAKKLPLSLILEPVGRNTAAAAVAAALMLVETDPTATLLILAADHLIADQAAFAQAVARAQVLAQAGKLVTFGITPTEPETGYGYIEHTGETVIRFIEKPDLPQAEQYVAEGRFLWNSGMFCFKAQTLIDEMAKFAPILLAGVRATLAQSKISRGDRFFRCDLEANAFASVVEDSLDYAVMEHTQQAAVVPCAIGWTDIGSWRAMSLIGDTDAEGNTLKGEVILHDVNRCYIHAEERMIGAVGVEDLVIIETADAVLVAHKDRSQDVKKLYTQLKNSGHAAHQLHQTVHRPWGTYTVLEEGDGFKMKRIVVKPGASLSLQMHHHRSEHWIVVSGSAIIINGTKEIFLRTNHSTYIQAGDQHRLTNPGKINLVMIEVQTGQYLGEDDIVRFEDIYGRVAINKTPV